MSQICGYEIKINLEFHAEFTDRIIYPERFYGDHYYRPKYNKIINSILKIIGISIPLVPIQHSRFSKTITLARTYHYSSGNMVQSHSITLTFNCHDIPLKKECALSLMTNGNGNNVKFSNY